MRHALKLAAPENYGAALFMHGRNSSVRLTNGFNCATNARGNAPEYKIFTFFTGHNVREERGCQGISAQFSGIVQIFEKMRYVVDLRHGGLLNRAEGPPLSAAPFFCTAI